MPLRSSAPSIARVCAFSLALAGALIDSASANELAKPISQALEQVQAVPGAFPAAAVVIVQGEAEPWIQVRGHTRADGGEPADADTRFYIASQTKSFMGLLAAVLDRRGELPLDTSLAEIWPGLRLPAPADPHRITMADLLSHQEGLSTDTLNFLTAYVRDVPAAEYPSLLATEVQVRSPGFRYANIGDLIYGAALEARTGRSWRDWMQASLLQPLALEGASPRSSMIDPRKIAWNHQWNGRAWRAFAPKPDALMHAAGGMLASPKAMARWMQLNLGLGALPADVTADDFRRSLQPIAKAKLADGEIDCDGYSLGWYRCVYKEQEAFMHPGSYVGAVSVTVLVPSSKAGMSLMVASDSAMEGLQLELMKAFIGLATGQTGEDVRLRRLVADYPSRLETRINKRLQAIAAARAEADWGDWRWNPDAAQRQACTGRFSDAVFGTMELGQEGSAWFARIGEMRLALEPAQPGMFAATDGSFDEPEPLRCDAATGTVRWRGRDFRKP
ncbi:serine hydrolase domain-containing protein [Arenimonas sp.]|uniref:serine hydrolase domain-containing protein n=1 Tax=Arenimonas sp. TaxID=1872635 RepID=UPI0039E23C36